MTEASGLSPLAVVSLQVIGYSTLLFPYQAPPIVFASELGGIRLRDATRLDSAASACTSLPRGGDRSIMRGGACWGHLK
ncbi:hypothetical protein ACU4GR_00800 [Methylobacterium oryzae CBMB20]